MKGKGFICSIIAQRKTPDRRVPGLGEEWKHLPKAEGQNPLASLLAYHLIFGEPEGIRTLDPLIKSPIQAETAIP
jgi:hypothetical protein